MNRRSVIAFLSLVSVSLVSCVSKPHTTADGHAHYSSNKEHNTEYDHQLFLGSEAKTFDQLTPEESKERLSAVVVKIDQNGDRLISREELRQWIEYTQKRYISDDVERQWKTYTAEKKDVLSWDEYKTMVYGFMDRPNPEELDSSGAVTYKEMLRRDQRRWNKADSNGDGSLNKDEFMDFLHPENALHMRDTVVTETMEDMDKDKDGKVSVNEYIGDMYIGTDGEDEPDWVKNERQQFRDYRDKNQDGFLDAEEVKLWIIPPDLDHADAEAKHLINESDTNNDGLLTREEILNNYDLFVGSQATGFGEALARHDEF